LGGLDPCSSSKSCAELAVNSYNNSFLKKKNIHVATVRAGNVIGGSDF
jgi:CDP-glucose 4,6-dehydratase